MERYSIVKELTDLSIGLEEINQLLFAEKSKEVVNLSVVREYTRTKDDIREALKSVSGR